MISIQTPAPDLNSARTSAAKITNQVRIRQAVPAGRILLHRDPTYMETAGEAAFSLVRAALTSR